MNKKLIKVAISTALASTTGITVAAPFNSFDPRSMAMGSAGVAVANTATAPYFNPSLLAVTPDRDDFALELPIIGARAYDPDDFNGSIDDFQDAGYDTTLANLVDQISADLNSNNAAALPGEYSAAADATAVLDGGLHTLDNKPLQVEAGAATVVGIPGKEFSIAFSATGTVMLGGVFNYNDSDFLNGIEADLRTMADTPSCFTNPASCPTGLTYIDTDPNSPTFLEVVNADGTPFDPTTDIKSTVDVRGVMLGEVGLSFAREVNFGATTVALGITPKYVKAIVYDYQENANVADSGSYNIDDYSKEYTNANFDIGMAKDFANGWRTGLVVKNVFAQQYETYRLNPDTGVKEKTGNSVELNPQARAGVSHSGDWHTVAFDVDLTENEPVGYEKASRYLALGGEFNLTDWAQLRAGYRMNTLDNKRNTASMGIGISPLGVHLDLAVAKSSNEVGASAQLGFRF